MEYILGKQSEIYSNVFFGSIFVFLILELLIPFRDNTSGYVSSRWMNNMVLGGLNIFLVRFLIPISTIGIAVLVEERQLGLLNQVSINPIIEVLFAFIVIDLVGYLFHRASHTYPLLWRFHLTHHTDLAIDLTTSVRHHLVEILLLILLTTMLILFLGLPVLAIFLYQVINFFVNTFSHANIKLPLYIDQTLRLIIITPDFHRIHHYAEKKYTNSNYGNVLTWWDYLFGSYQNKSRDESTLGLEYYRSNREQMIDRLLTQPFRYSSVKNSNNARAGETSIENKHT